MFEIEVPPPSIYVYGVRIDEPIATLTDLMISAVCLYAFVRMRKSGDNTWSKIHLRNYFLFISIATVLGGFLGHGFLYAFDTAWKLPGWIMGIISVALIERSSISHAQPLIKPWIGSFLMVFNVIEMLVILVITIATIDFKWVEYHNAYGFIVNVVGFHGYTYYRTRDKGSLIILIGVGITTVASVVFTRQLSLHTWFNYVDISHVLLAIAGYVIYLGGMRLQTDGRKKKTSQPLRKTMNLRDHSV